MGIKIHLKSFAIASVLGLSFALPQGGPVQVRIETDNIKNFHIGPQDRTTFELVEQYKPLSTAYNTKNRPRVYASSLSKPPFNHSQPVQLLIEFPTSISSKLNNPHTGRASEEAPSAILTPRSLNKNRKSEWLEWTAWSKCENGERVKVRKCLEFSGIKCDGPNTEKQRCFSPAPSKIPFARDPSIIEREIIGDFPNRH